MLLRFCCIFCTRGSIMTKDTSNEIETIARATLWMTRLKRRPINSLFRKRKKTKESRIRQSPREYFIETNDSYNESTMHESRMAFTDCNVTVQARSAKRKEENPLKIQISRIIKVTLRSLRVPAFF